MQLADFDMEFSSDLRTMFGALEEQLSEASARSIGGLRTEDQKFAYAVENQLRDTLRFMDRLEDLMREIILSCNSQVDDAESSRDIVDEKLSKIQTYIADFQRMDNIKRIITD